MTSGNYRKAVGELAQQAAILEGCTGILLWGLASVEQRIGRIACPTDMKGMLRAIRLLVRERELETELSREVLRWVKDVGVRL